VRLVQDGVRWHEGPGFEEAMPADLVADLRENGDLVFAAGA
jgi:hypothetical protein